MIRKNSVIPLKDNIPTRTFPIITVGLVFVNIVIFVWQNVVLHASAGATLYTYYGLVPREFIASVFTRHDLLPYNIMTIFTSMFLHGGILHICLLYTSRRFSMTAATRWER